MHSKWTREDSWAMVALLKKGKKPRKVKKKIKRILAKREIVNPPSKIYAMSRMQDIHNHCMYLAAMESPDIKEMAKQLVKDYLNEE